MAQWRVLFPAGRVHLPGGQTVPLDRAAITASRAVVPPSARPALRQPALAHAPVRAPERVLAPPGMVTIPGRAAPLPLAGEELVPMATSVGLIPAAGTQVTATPANLLAGPEADISDFTILTLDSGTW